MWASIDLPPREKAKFCWRGSWADRLCTGVLYIIGWETGWWIIRHISIVFH